MTRVTSATITPECRTGRGDDGAWDEAVSRLRAKYDHILDGWKGIAAQPTLRLALEMERPAPSGETTG